MSKIKTLQRMLGVATLAMMFGTGAAWAQAAKETPKDAAGMTPQNKAGQMSPTGSNDNTSAAATPAQAGSSGSSGTASKSSGASGSDSSAASGSNSSGTTGAASTATGSAKLSRGDEKIMKDLAQANISEIEAGKMAQSKTQNDQVKTFAQKMIDDHTKAQQDLEALAQQKGVTLPTEPDTKHKAAMKMMGALSGDKFDAAYMKQGGLNDHKNTHKMLTQAERKAKDADLKALVAKTTPVIDQHLTMAQDVDKSRASGTMSGSSKGSAGTSASGTSGSSSNTGTSGTSGSSSSTGK